MYNYALDLMLQVDYSGTTSGRNVDLVSSYMNSDWYKSLQKNLNTILEQADRDKERSVAGHVGKKLKTRHHQYATSFLWQVYMYWYNN